ncbi:glycerol kinase GlpK [Vibrio sp. B1Z05]|uniref:glycerol kinase GlpK n=1 Tax=Vibrio sp. B1Z05 TaxID=2654980 RepID=UPI00128BB331|nr:glycerol kinase GlpK [Vibrio sp. B1Z05]MPW35802.1 glycerol kinase GlpK [Vibrio sp. B1Z05]
MATGSYIVALDQGTTSSRAVVFDSQANIVAQSQREFTQYYPQAGWVEHDPMEIYSSQRSTLIDVLDKLSITPEDVAGIGITNQRETTIVWHKETGKPIYNAIVWQCRRTSQLCKELREQGWEEYIKTATGLVLDPYFSASKIKWILDNVAGARVLADDDKLLFGTVDTWLLWKLTHGKVHATDHTNASRTMMFNINTMQWDENILKLLDIPKSMLPEVKPSSSLFGETCIGENSEIRIPVAGIAGDQQASLFGHRCVNPGQVKNTYGTGCFLLMNTGSQKVDSQHGLLTTLACDAEGKPCYALEGAVFMAGASIQWLRDELRLLNESKDSEYYANKVDSSDGVYVVPAFTGLGAPYWDPYARGTMVGLTRGTSAEHIVRATLESIAYQTYDVIHAMQADSCIELSSLRVDGGAARNNFLMQFQSDLLNCEVQRPQLTEVTALGAAFLAGLSVGYWKDLSELEARSEIETRYHPLCDSEKRTKRYAGWQRAIKCAQMWSSLQDEE